MESESTCSDRFLLWEVSTWWWLIRYAILMLCWRLRLKKLLASVWQKGKRTCSDRLLLWARQCSIAEEARLIYMQTLQKLLSFHSIGNELVSFESYSEEFCVWCAIAEISHFLCKTRIVWEVLTKMTVHVVFFGISRLVSWSNSGVWSVLKAVPKMVLSHSRNDLVSFESYFWNNALDVQ